MKKYPYLPKSNLKIELGEYWSLTLDNGKYAFFVFLDIPTDGDQRSVLIGLVDYTSFEPLLLNSRHKILWQSVVHIKSVAECGGLVQGKIAKLSPLLERCSHGGKHCQILCGFSPLRMATPEDMNLFDVRKASGFMVPRTVANKLLNSD